mmetsp:Transcript_43576/g.52704  ORF Transcript_43576/g.52704 Transcript_43576/m.52704 type:complete len:441 (+) Transcript_43576:140-1462(+)|eukprot:CAMPEP_0197859482 /NCGR_PEP_ID=MMETSP1438-20131217/34073_1 /TAXON_ID=1461541 /ORGANISM="Pterosperma sp., Strain CCMP1384" /LENGTH=440 /DNA_ID=CAMNT_0043475981 /DNA_START=136 /DNA_END=1458 /DNA_ORIENTATION=+
MPFANSLIESMRLTSSVLRQGLFSVSSAELRSNRSVQLPYQAQHLQPLVFNGPGRRRYASAATTGKRGKKAAADTGAKKDQALQSVLDSIDASFGKGSIMRMGNTSADHLKVETFSSGSLALDVALGGGFPKGRIVEIYGPESSGKTTLAMHAMAEVQKTGGVAALIDAEHAFDPVYAATLGMDVEKLVVCQPESGEMALEVVDQLVRSSAVDVICVDSVAALVPRAEIEGEIGLVQVGTQARLMSQALRKLTTNAAKCGCGVIFINQLRHKIGVIYGSPEVTSGGNALKFYASVRVDIRRIQTLKGSDGVETGIRVRTKVVKNKVARPYRTAEMDLLFGTGISSVGSILECAETVGVVEKKGSWYSYGTTRLGQGRQKSVEFLAANPDVASEIEKKVQVAMGGNSQDVGVEDADMDGLDLEMLADADDEDIDDVVLPAK